MGDYVPKGRVEFNVVGGLCRIQFDPGMSCGRDDDCNPGVGFALIGDSPSHHAHGKHYSGMGVFGRSDARRLRDMLDLFLAGIEPEAQPAELTDHQ